MITLSLGRRERGKTTLAYFIAHRSPTRVIFDPRRMFATSPVRVSDGSVYDLLDTQEEVIVQPRFNVPSVFESTCIDLMQWVEDNPEEPVAFLVDEARFVDTPSSIPESFDYLLRCSNRENVQIFMTAHRPVDISVDIRAIADYWALFHTTQEHDLKVIGERCGEEVADKVSSLGPRELVLWNDGIGTFRVYANQKDWYIDIAKDQRKEKESNVSA